MINLFNSAVNSTPILILTVIYVITSSITTFDVRLMQAKRHGTLPSDETLLPDWTAIFIWLDWGILIALIFLNWRYAILVYGIIFILKVLPVLETIGGILMSPFRANSSSKQLRLKNEQQFSTEEKESKIAKIVIAVSIMIALVIIMSKYL